MMGGARLWASAIRRRRLAASVFLALFAGLAGGVVMTSMEVARRTSSALDRYLDQPTVAQRGVSVCPVGVTGEEPDFDPGVQCSGIADLAAAAQLLRGSPLVADVTPAATLITALSRDGTGPWNPIIQIAVIDGIGPGGAIRVEGRAPRSDAADEIALNEPAARRYGLSAGDDVTMGVFSADQRLDIASKGQADEPAGPHARVRVVGVYRAVEDLAPDAEAEVLTPPGWWRTYGRDDLAGYGRILAVRLHDRSTAAGFDASLTELLPGRIFQSQELSGSPESTRRVIELQSAAAWAVAVAALIAALGFVGQAVRRQSIQDLADRETVGALGMTRWDMLAGLALGALPVAIGASIIAATAAVLASPVGPVGQARPIEISPGINVDGAVIGLGGLSVASFVVMVAVGAALIELGRRDRAIARPHVSRFSFLPVSPRAGLGLLRRTDRSALSGAVAGTALAITAVIFASGVSASHADLMDHPARYGQTWQALAGNFGNQEEIDAGEASAAKIGDIGEYGLTRQTAAATIEGRPVYVFAFTRKGPLVRPVILEGREPGPGEVALGAKTMAIHHLHVGDPVTIRGQFVGPPLTLTVVGRAIINDGSGTGTRLDDGALVDDSDFPDTGDSPQYLLVRGRAGVSSTRLVDRLKADFGESATPPRVPADVANLDRVSATPTLLAALIAVLAASALANALVTIVGRRGRDIGVLRALGFTRAQVLRSTTTIATVAALAASIIGIPLGVIVARWGWSAVESRIGVESGVVLPILWVVATTSGVVAIAHLIALIPGIRAVRVRAGRALRSE